jgi:two-component system, NtrC family, response regulator AtoC
MSIGSTILVVDDEKNAREGLKQFLLDAHYDALDASSGSEALDIVKQAKPEVVLTDLKMPEMDGVQLLHAIHRIRPETIVIVLTAYGTVESAVQAMKAGAFHYLTKPVNFDELELALKKALHQNNLETENKSLREELHRERHETDQIIGKSETITKLVAVAKQVAESDSTVLIQGESGTGKELIAHLIHASSLRAKQTFVTIHMAALTETLLASELFGHERGAFTGATERKVGRFERANGGTLFLDEVSEIPEGMQTKLLRVLQSGEFERVGGSKTLHSDVRLVCATNKNLEAQVREGKFREDLFYRLNVILLDVPPLREHKSDITLLANHYLALFNARNRKTIQTITPGAMKLLSDYDWPGNVRELKNVMERIVVLTRTDVIDIEQIPDDLKRGKRITNGAQVTSPAATTIQSMEEEMIRRTLSEVNQNKSLAAKKLGISRRTLYRKIEEYNITGAA